VVSPNIGSLLPRVSSDTRSRVLAILQRNRVIILSPPFTAANSRARGGKAAKPLRVK
jgi:hypothetical protein